MPGELPRWPAALGLAASSLGLAFAGSSTLDYARHLDRQVHDIHCSYVPGMGAETTADNACRVAMYSPFSALLRDRYWGGVPIALFAVGAFVFFAAFTLYLLLGNRSAPRRAAQFLAFAGAAPLLVSILMGTISAVRLGHFCKTCVGIYVASALLAVAGAAAWALERRAARLEAFRSPFPGSGRERAPAVADNPWERPAAAVPPTVVEEAPKLAPRRTGGMLLLPAWLAALGAFTLTPALLYVSALPSYGSYLGRCGKLEKPVESTGALLHPGRSAQGSQASRGGGQLVTMFVDPLCPTCKALHRRLASEGFLEQLDVTLVLFPLDSDCNWMLDSPVHPGSCAVSKAILCSDHRAMQVLEWAYDRQDDLLSAAKAAAGSANVRAMIQQRWPGMDACMDSKETAQRLSRMLRYIVANHLQVSTPQLFLGDTRVCDEDTDMGLTYTLLKLAPALRSP